MDEARIEVESIPNFGAIIKLRSHFGYFFDGAHHLPTARFESASVGRTCLSKDRLSTLGPCLCFPDYTFATRPLANPS